MEYSMSNKRRVSSHEVSGVVPRTSEIRIAGSEQPWAEIWTRPRAGAGSSSSLLSSEGS